MVDKQNCGFREEEDVYLGRMKSPFLATFEVRLMGFGLNSVVSGNASIEERKWSEIKNTRQSCLRD